MKTTPKAFTFLTKEVSLGVVRIIMSTNIITHEYDKLNWDQLTDKSTTTFWPVKYRMIGYKLYESTWKKRTRPT